MLSAFDKLRRKYPNIYLILRTALPEFEARYLEIIERHNIKVIDQFLPEEEWDALLRSVDIYLFAFSAHTRGFHFAGDVLRFGGGG